MPRGVSTLKAIPCRKPSLGGSWGSHFADERQFLFTRAGRLASDLREYGLTAFCTEDMDRTVQPGEIMIVHGNLHRGMEYPLIKFAIIAESDIFGEEKKKKRREKLYEGEKVKSFMDLSIGDYVVHENHGLGVYKGIEKVEVDGVAKDYIKI